MVDQLNSHAQLRISLQEKIFETSSSEVFFFGLGSAVGGLFFVSFSFFPSGASFKGPGKEGGERGEPKPK